MPELPEVETIKNAVEKAVNGAYIEKAEVRNSRLRETIPADFAEKICGTEIIGLRRIAKYMLMDLNNGYTIIWHFGMSGKIKIETSAPANPEKHDHVIITTNRGMIIYNDPRRFGLISLCKSSALADSRYFEHIGLDPWDERLTAEYLLDKLAKRKTAIKLSLLNQEIICGIGNIYASEILYKAHISPLRASESITAKEAKDIILYTRQILKESIQAGGSTIHDYHRPDGDIGYFQQRHCVYNKTGQRCPDCVCKMQKNEGIRKIIQGGRSTFYCPVLQK